jgi:hypothetical protein
MDKHWRRIELLGETPLPSIDPNASGLTGEHRQTRLVE